MSASTFARAAQESPTAQVELCAACHEPLLLELEVDDDYVTDEETDLPEAEVSTMKAGSKTGGSETVLDDVEVLQCRCHFHWYAHRNLPWN